MLFLLLYSLSLFRSDFVPGKVGTWQISHSQTRNKFSYINQQDSGGTRKPSLCEGMPVCQSIDFDTDCGISKRRFHDVITTCFLPHA